MRIHIIGIGGIGTSALSRWFLNDGYKVSGSDRSASLITNELKKEGAKIYIGHKAKNVPPDANLIIRSEAIRPDNPELKRAKELSIPVKSYSEALRSLIKNYKTIAVAGAHGKSTTTGILSSILIKNNFDPTIIIGTKIKELKNKNFRKGKSDWLLLEADEYHGAFLNYSPFAAIITNIDREHLDYYKNISEIKKTFLKFISNITPGGILVLNKNDKNLFSLKNSISKIAEKNKLRVYWYGVNNSIDKIMKISGRHNLSNATGAYVLSKALGIKEKDILNGISSYRGAWRRMEYKGNMAVSRKYEVSSKKRPIPNTKHLIRNTDYFIPVFDDYAHHPSEIKATLSAFREKFPKQKIICVFQPHSANRLKSLFKEFTFAFSDADALIILPVFKVAGRDSFASPKAGKMSQNISPSGLADSIKKSLKTPKNGPKTAYEGRLKPEGVFYLPRTNSLLKRLKILAQNSPSVIVMMGAGDVYKLTPKLVSSII